MSKRTLWLAVLSAPVAGAIAWATGAAILGSALVGIAFGVLNGLADFLIATIRSDGTTARHRHVFLGSGLVILTLAGATTVWGTSATAGRLLLLATLYLSMFLFHRRLYPRDYTDDQGAA